jgi:hypothetical protein
MILQGAIFTSGPPHLTGVAVRFGMHNACMLSFHVETATHQQLNAEHGRRWRGDRAATLWMILNGPISPQGADAQARQPAP